MKNTLPLNNTEQIFVDLGLIFKIAPVLVVSRFDLDWISAAVDVRIW